MIGINRKTFAAVILLVLFLGMHVSASEQHITVVLYYSASCGSCKAAVQTVNELQQNYTNDAIVFIEKDVSGNQTNRDEWKSYGFTTYPCVVINNETLIPKQNITLENLETILDSYIALLEVEEPQDNSVVFIIMAATACLLVVLVALAWKQRQKE